MFQNVKISLKGIENLFAKSIKELQEASLRIWQFTIETKGNEKSRVESTLLMQYAAKWCPKGLNCPTLKRPIHFTIYQIGVDVHTRFFSFFNRPTTSHCNVSKLFFTFASRKSPVYLRSENY